YVGAAREERQARKLLRRTLSATIRAAFSEGSLATLAGGGRGRERLGRLRRLPRKILSWLTLRDEPSALRHGAVDSHTTRRLPFRSPVDQLAERLATAEHARTNRPDRHVEDRRGLLI